MMFSVTPVPASLITRTAGGDLAGEFVSPCELPPRLICDCYDGQASLPAYGTGVAQCERCRGWGHVEIDGGPPVVTRTSAEQAAFDDMVEQTLAAGEPPAHWLSPTVRTRA